MNWFLDTLKNRYADFNGRARRKEYWMFSLFYCLIALLILLPSMFLPESELIATGSLIIFGIYVLAMFIPNLAVNIRRLHDTGRSGWWYLITMVPIIGIFYIVFMCLDSQTGTNKYGNNPKEAQ